MRNDIMMFLVCLGLVVGACGEEVTGPVDTGAEDVAADLSDATGEALGDLVDEGEPAVCGTCEVLTQCDLGTHGELCWVVAPCADVCESRSRFTPCDACDDVCEPEPVCTD